MDTSTTDQFTSEVSTSEIEESESSREDSRETEVNSCGKSKVCECDEKKKMKFIIILLVVCVVVCLLIVLVLSFLLVMLLYKNQSSPPTNNSNWNNENDHSTSYNYPFFHVEDEKIRGTVSLPERLEEPLNIVDEEGQVMLILGEEQDVLHVYKVALEIYCCPYDTLDGNFTEVEGMEDCEWKEQRYGFAPASDKENAMEMIMDEGHFDAPYSAALCEKEGWEVVIEPSAAFLREHSEVLYDCRGVCKPNPYFEIFFSENAGVELEQDVKGMKEVYEEAKAECEDYSSNAMVTENQGRVVVNNKFSRMLTSYCFEVHKRVKDDERVKTLTRITHFCTGGPFFCEFIP